MLPRQLLFSIMMMLFLLPAAGAQQLELFPPDVLPPASAVTPKPEPAPTQSPANGPSHSPTQSPSAPTAKKEPLKNAPAAASYCESLASQAVEQCSGQPAGRSKRSQVAHILAQIQAHQKDTSAAISEHCKSSLSTVDSASETNFELGQQCLSAIGDCEDRCRAEIEQARSSPSGKEQLPALIAGIKVCQDQVEKAQALFAQSNYYKNARKKILDCITVSTITNLVKPDSKPEALTVETPSLAGAPATADSSANVNPIDPPPFSGSLPTPIDSGDNTMAQAPSTAPTGAPKTRGLSSDRKVKASSGGESYDGPEGRPLPSATDPIKSPFGPLSERVAAMARRAPERPIKISPMEFEESAGGGGDAESDPQTPAPPMKPASAPPFLVKRASPGKPVTRSMAEASYCSATEGRSKSALCSDPHLALCGDTSAPKPMEMYVEPVWDRIRIARQSFFEQNFAAIKQVLGKKGPTAASPAAYRGVEKDRYLREYAVQAAIEIEKLKSASTPLPPEQNQRLMEIFIFNLWNATTGFLPDADRVRAAGEKARTLVNRAVSGSELDSSDRKRLRDRLASVKIIAHDLKARPSSSRDNEHLFGYMEACGVAPLSVNARYSLSENTLLACGSVFDDSLSTAPGLMLLTHELSHSLDPVALNDEKIYRGYLTCLEERPDSALGNSHPRGRERSSEAVADLWMSRAIATSSKPLYLSIDHERTERYLRQTFTFFCHRDPDLPPAPEDSTNPPVRFRINEVFGRDSWTRWQTGCADLCNSEKVCTLKGPRLDGEEKPR